MASAWVPFPGWASSLSLQGGWPVRKGAIWPGRGSVENEIPV